MQCVDVSKFKRHDRLPLILFKRMDTLKTSINGFFRTIKRTLTFRSLCKIGEVKPLFEKGIRALVTNYGPMKLLCTLSKVFKTLHKSQCQFSKGKSTIVLLFCFLDENYKNVQIDHVCVEALYLDFEKALDKIDHFILIEKLKSIGVDGKLLNSLGSYLSDRKEFVEINGYKLFLFNVSRCVPQGSIHSPILFFIYVIDLSRGMMSSFYRLADDSKMLSIHGQKKRLMCYLRT